MRALGIDWQVAYLVLAVVVLVSLAALGAFGWRFRRADGAREFLLLIGSGLGWMITVLLMAITPPEQVKGWLSLKYLFIAGAPIGLFLYALAITGQAPRWRGALIIGLAVIPALTQAILWNPGTYGWMIGDLQADKIGILTRVTRITFGPFYWVTVLQGYALMLVSIGLLTVCAIRANALVRARLVTIALAACAPLIANVLLITGIAPREFDPMPFGAAVMSYLIWWAVIRHRVFDLSPVARNRLMDVMDNPVLAVDGDARIIDCNRAMARVLQRTPRQLLGTPVEPVLRGAGARPDASDLTRLVAMLGAVEEHASPVADRPLLRIDGRHFASRIVPLPGSRAGQSDGRLLILDDVTDRVLSEANLSRALAEVRTLRGLLPICASCKQIKDSRGVWRPVDEYIAENSEADLTHTVCATCLAVHYPKFSSLGQPGPSP